MEDDKNMFWGLFTVGFALLLIVISIGGIIYLCFFPVHCVTDSHSYIDPYNYTTVTKETELGCFTLSEVLKNKEKWDKKAMSRVYNSKPDSSFTNSSSGSSSIGAVLFNISSASSLS